MRWLLLLLLALPFLTACEEGINLKIDNQTDQTLCSYESVPLVGRSGYCSEIKANDSVAFSRNCQSDEYVQDVVLTPVGSDEVIYNRSATCGEWEDHGAKVTVSKEGDDYQFRDGFP